MITEKKAMDWQVLHRAELYLMLYLFIETYAINILLREVVCT